MEYRDAVRSTVFVAGIVVTPRELMGAALKALRGFVFSHRGVRNVVSVDDSPTSKMVLLDPALVSPSAASPSDLPQEMCTRVEQALGDKGSFRVVSNHAVELTYENFTMPELLRKVLPAGITALSGFEQVGHIAHVNLSDQHLPYSKMIGQVILDSNPTVRTVVNKVGVISSVFREFQMDVIAGDASALTATVKQHGFLFQVPYDKVYWNSRLGDEHDRLVSLMRSGDELFDVMAGVGPFAVPAAAAGVIVHANDLNPASVDAMRVNAKLNGVTLTAYNMDGRAFLEDVLRQGHLEKSVLRDGHRRHVSMNLPALAVTFLDVFTKPTWRTGALVDRFPVIHCYTFSPGPDVKEEAVQQVEAVLGVSIRDDIELVHDVRDVAPAKQMVCVSFRLPKTLTEETRKRPRGDSPADCTP